ncbi:MAG TPA: Holliday junction resolvase RuvX [Gemmatimonadaceae bacterium]|nr:Holliday junction resolvase RuvX [Gemmatimonadaceae bacterium]
MRTLAIDVGDKRFGLAVSDPLGMIASPAGFIMRRRGKKIPVQPLIERANELGADAFVVGLALDGDGNDTPRAVDARWLAAELTRRTGKPSRLVDERFTTAIARRAVRAMDGDARERRGDVDALAATVLLQHALGLTE